VAGEEGGEGAVDLYNGEQVGFVVLFLGVGLGWGWVGGLDGLSGWDGVAW